MKKFTKRGEVEQWIKDHQIANATINNDLSIDVEGSVSLRSRLFKVSINQWIADLERENGLTLKHHTGSEYVDVFSRQVYEYPYLEMRLEEFPVNFGKVSGSFDVSNNNLRSLKGCPIYVGCDFDCSRNDDLLSLSGGPLSVGGSYNCEGNKLESLEGAPKSIAGIFTCTGNRLTTLKGAPEEIGIDFDCDFNRLTSLVGAPKSVGGVFTCDYNNLLSLEGAPSSVGEDFSVAENHSLPHIGAIETKIGGRFIASFSVSQFSGFIGTDQTIVRVPTEAFNEITGANKEKRVLEEQLAILLSPPVAPCNTPDNQQQKAPKRKMKI